MRRQLGLKRYDKSRRRQDDRRKWEDGITRAGGDGKEAAMARAGSRNTETKTSVLNK